MTTKNRATVKTRNTSVMAGIDKHITGNVTIGGATYTPMTLKQVFLDENTAIDSAESLHTQWQDQVLTTKAAQAKANATYQSLRTFLIGQYGSKANSVLNDFGMTGPKKGTTKVATKAAAAKKAAATRAIRNTKGPVKRKAQKGVIEVPVQATTTITPVMPPPVTTTITEPAAPAPTAAAPPAATASSAKPGS
jgi:hypothetical protein